MRTLMPRLQEAALARSIAVLREDAAVVSDCRRLLWPLQREDEERDHNLLQTIQAYYDCGLRVDRTAERLFLHRNSVRYRLDRIRTLLRCDIDHPRTIAAVTLALAVCGRQPLVEEGSRHAV